MFVAKFGEPKNKLTQDLLASYIDELVFEIKGAKPTPKQIQKLKHILDSGVAMVNKIASQSLVGADGKPLDGASTGPSPADDQLGLYKDFKQFIKARVAGGSQSEDKTNLKILYLEARISELQGYLQSNSVDRIRQINKIQTRFLKDANGPEAMKGRRRAWVAQLGLIGKLEGILEDSRIKLGKARVSEALLREQVKRDKKTLAVMHKAEDDSQSAARIEAQRKFDEAQKKQELKNDLARQRLNVSSDIVYEGKHNHAAAASAAPAAAAAKPAKRRRGMFADDEAEEAPEDEDEALDGYD